MKPRSYFYSATDILLARTSKNKLERRSAIADANDGYDWLYLPGAFNRQMEVTDYPRCFRFPTR